MIFFVFADTFFFSIYIQGAPQKKNPGSRAKISEKPQKKTPSTGFFFCGFSEILGFQKIRSVPKKTAKKPPRSFFNGVSEFFGFQKIRPVPKINARWKIQDPPNPGGFFLGDGLILSVCGRFLSKAEYDLQKSGRRFFSKCGIFLCYFLH